MVTSEAQWAELLHWGHWPACNAAERYDGSLFGSSCRQITLQTGHRQTMFWRASQRVARSGKHNMAYRSAAAGMMVRRASDSLCSSWAR